MAVINFVRNDTSDLSSIRLEDGKTILNIVNGEMVIYHDYESNGILNRVSLSGGSGGGSSPSASLKWFDF